MISHESATEAWLGTKSANTRRAYARALELWRGYCARKGLDPLEPTVVDLDGFKAELLVGAPASAAVRMAAVKSWHKYLRLNGLIASEASVLVERVRVSRRSASSRSLSPAEVGKMLIEADRRAEVSAAWSEIQQFVAVRDAAIVRMLLTLGLREGDLTALDVESLGYDNGMRVVDVVGKGGVRTRRPVPPSLEKALGRYLALESGEGPLFITIDGDRMDPSSINDVVERVAKGAGLAATPHMLRHTFASHTTVLGASLDDLQIAMGHADPETTRRYQSGVQRLERDPAHLMEQQLLELAA